MPPAHQRLDSRTAPAVDVDEGLVVHLELAPRDGVAQIAFQRLRASSSADIASS